MVQSVQAMVTAAFAFTATSIPRFPFPPFPVSVFLFSRPALLFFSFFFEVFFFSRLIEQNIFHFDGLPSVTNTHIERGRGETTHFIPPPAPKINIICAESVHENCRCRGLQMLKASAGSSSSSSNKEPSWATAAATGTAATSEATAATTTTTCHII